MRNYSGNTMTLIENLGLHYPTETSKEKKLFGIYECPICKGYFKCTIANVKRGATTKCRQCADTLSATATSERASSTFKDDATSIHSGLYDYSLVEYVNSYTKVKIICKVHGVFEQTPNSHKAGHGCKKCMDTLKIEQTANSFVEEAKEIHGNRYDYSEVVYKGSGVKIRIICKEHGIFTQTPSSHKKGSGCPQCSITGFDKTKSAILYYLKIVHNGNLYYKVGITNRTIKERFSLENLAKIEILRTWDFPIGKDAYDKEQEIIKLHKEFKHTGDHILDNGNTEIFYKDILCLDYTC